MRSGGAHFSRSFASLAKGGPACRLWVASNGGWARSLLATGLGLARLKVWNGLSFLFGGRRAAWYSITDRRVTHPEEFKADMTALFDLLREGAIHPGGLGGKIVLLPWPEPG